MLKKAQVESLWGLIEALRKRSLDYGNDLKASEALTRYALVDPLLWGMGWDTGDPAQVRPEYTIGDGRADYALFRDGQNNPTVLIEAKSLQTEAVRGMSDAKGRWRHLREAVIQNVGHYCLADNIRYAAVTDGQRWEIYDTYQSRETRNEDGQVLDGMWIKSFNLFDLEGELSINKYRLMEELRLAEELWRDNPNHKGTKRIVEAGERCLDAEGYELTPGGNRSKDKDGNLKEAYPRAAEYRVGKYFLDVNGYKLKKNGAPYNVSKPYEPPSGYKGPYRYQPPAKKRRRRR